MPGLQEAVSERGAALQLRWAVVCDGDLPKYISAEDRR